MDFDRKRKMKELYQSLLEDETVFSLIYVTCISSDTNISLSNVKDDLSLVEELLEASENFKKDETNKKYIKLLNEGKQILLKDLEYFNSNEKDS